MLPDAVVKVVGTPMNVEPLKNKPGRRQTVRAAGPRGSVIVKIYESNRALVVAERVAALGEGPAEPLIPRVLHVDPDGRFVVLSDIAGRPLRDALVGGEIDVCRRVGHVLGRWHGWWSSRVPRALRVHTADREADILRQRAASATADIAAAATSRIAALAGEWPAATVVHRDLYEDQILVGERVGLIDLDDAAVGPPELDLGNLIAHIQMLALRRGMDVRNQVGALVAGYDAAGPLDGHLLERCRGLSLLRLACLNGDARLLDLAESRPVAA